MVLKKKEIIAASLVVLIGVAGYLNWSYQDTIKVRDGETYVETGKRLGEAQYVSSNEENVEKTDGEEKKAEQTSADENKEENKEEKKAEETAADSNANVTEEKGAGADYFDKTKQNREESRSKSLEILNQTAENESFDAEIRKKAGDKILAVADNVQKENEIEGIARSKGYSEICVYVDVGDANVMVRKDGFNDEDVLKLTEIVTDQLKISAQNVKIVEVK
ncbi:MAG: SpoIIIAH-like family protein [Clostridia bacterium]|nr:SpoIIIAH-like family protein [Clostridia bacterium]